MTTQTEKMLYRTIEQALGRVGQAEEWMRQNDQSNWWRGYQVPWTPASLDDWELYRFSIPQQAPGRLHYVLEGGQERDPGWGEFTGLRNNDTLWMTDTRAEIVEHYPLFGALCMMAQGSTRVKVLINGLGLGMATWAALRTPNVMQVDVVELNQTVVELVGPQIAAQPKYGPKLRLHVDDAFEKRWRPGTRWDVVWHDIWPTAGAGNLTEMGILHRRYGHRTRWQGSWQKETCLKIRTTERRLERLVGKLPEGRLDDWQKFQALLK